MKILIVGGSGMLGHQLWRQLHARHETWVTLRKPAAGFIQQSLFSEGRVIAGVDAADLANLRRVIAELRPDAVLNCIGIIKQLKEAKDPIPSIEINALLPHRLAEFCAEAGSRLIHFSTDCVFNGQRGSYTEADASDAEDLYGRTKYLGEVSGAAHAVTLRSSIVGRELGSAHSLIDWFLSQEGKSVRGYRRAIYTGFTTIEMARIVESLLTRHTALSGLWQVASTPISKYELLQMVRAAFNRNIQIEPDDEVLCDRSLVGNAFNVVTDYEPPSWSSMSADMAACQ